MNFTAMNLKIEPENVLQFVLEKLRGWSHDVQRHTEQKKGGGLGVTTLVSVAFLKTLL